MQKRKATLRAKWDAEPIGTCRYDGDWYSWSYNHLNRDRPGGHSRQVNWMHWDKRMSRKKARNESIRYMRECLMDDISMAQALDEVIQDEEDRAWMDEYEARWQEEMDQLDDYNDSHDYDDEMIYGHDYWTYGEPRYLRDPYYEPTEIISRYELDKLRAAEKELAEIKRSREYIMDPFIDGKTLQEVLGHRITLDVAERPE